MSDPDVRKPDGGRRSPAPLNDLVSQQMSRMPTSSSKPELRLRQELHRLGLRFRIGGVKLPGRPDVVFTRAKLALFVDGCFWHRCPNHGTLPKNNKEWWEAKLYRNVARDREKDDELIKLGWLPIHVWEHEDPVEAAARVRGVWLGRQTGRPPRDEGVGSVVQV